MSINPRHSYRNVRSLGQVIKCICTNCSLLLVLIREKKFVIIFVTQDLGPHSLEAVLRFGEKKEKGQPYCTLKY